MQLGVGALVAAVVLIMGIIVATETIEKINQEPLYVNCCGGNECVDVYYNERTNTCHLILCEKLPFVNCTYPGENITFDPITEMIS